MIRLLLEALMSKLEIIVDIELQEEMKLLNAIKEASVDIGHRCGGNAGCTTCRVEFLEGEPDKMTRAEYNKLKDKDMLGKFRLSCQITCKTDMKIKPIMTLQNVEGWTDTGPAIAAAITPEPDWLLKTDLKDII